MPWFDTCAVVCGALLVAIVYVWKSFVNAVPQRTCECVPCLSFCFAMFTLSHSPKLDTTSPCSLSYHVSDKSIPQIGDLYGIEVYWNKADMSADADWGSWKTQALYRDTWHDIAGANIVFTEADILVDSAKSEAWFPVYFGQSVWPLSYMDTAASTYELSPPFYVAGKPETYSKDPLRCDYANRQKLNASTFANCVAACDLLGPRCWSIFGHMNPESPTATSTCWTCPPADRSSAYGPNEAGYAQWTRRAVTDFRTYPADKTVLKKVQITMAKPSLSINLVQSSLAETQKAQDRTSVEDAAIGETFKYEIKVDVIEGTTPVELTLRLPHSGKNLLAMTHHQFLKLPFCPIANTKAVESTKPVLSGRNLVWNLGSVINRFNALTNDDQVKVSVTLQVMNEPANKESTQIAFTTKNDYKVAAQTKTQKLDVGEPSIDVSISVDTLGAAVQAGATLRYTVKFDNGVGDRCNSKCTTESDLPCAGRPAYDVKLVIKLSRYRVRCHRRFACDTGWSLSNLCCVLDWFWSLGLGYIS